MQLMCVFKGKQKTRRVTPCKYQLKVSLYPLLSPIGSLKAHIFMIIRAKGRNKWVLPISKQLIGKAYNKGFLKKL